MAMHISVDSQTKEKLNVFKEYLQDSYNSVIDRLTRMTIDEDELSYESMEGIEEALEHLKMGRICSE